MNIKVTKDNFTCFLDVVYSDILPVNDFSCNLLTLELQKGVEIYKVHNVGISSLSKDYYFQFKFTIEDILKQIRKKITYILPDFLEKRQQCWENRVYKFSKNKGYTIINRVPYKNYNIHCKDASDKIFPDPNLIVDGIQIEMIIYHM